MSENGIFAVGQNIRIKRHTQMLKLVTKIFFYLKKTFFSSGDPKMGVRNKTKILYLLYMSVHFLYTVVCEEVKCYDLDVCKTTNKT